MTIIYFVIALGLLVFIHEFGHFIVAKKQGIGVETFSIGFGPKLFGFTRGETKYVVSLLPFGGYVKLHGEDPDAPESKDENDKKAYSRRPIWQRVLVVFAGPGMNLLLALLIMPVVFMIGRMEPIFLDQPPVVVGVRHDSAAAKAGIQKGDEILSADGTSMKDWKDFLDFILIHGKQAVELKIKRADEYLTKSVTIEESPDTHSGMMGIEPSYFIGNEAVVDEVTPGSPASEGGLKGGDEILKIDQMPVESWTDMSEQVGASGGKKLAISIRRGGEMLTVFVVPRYDEGMKKWLMGVKKDGEKRSGAFSLKKYGFKEALIRGTEENLKLAKLTLSVLGRLVTFKLSYKTLGGPIRIAQASAIAAKSGLADFLYFLAFLSMQLGVLNLLPMPVLDGGHLLFFSIEGLTRRPVSMRVRQIMEQVGFFVLISLMLLVTLNDVESVWGVHQIFDKIKHLF